MTHKFQGGYRLEMDQTWTELNRIGEIDEKRQLTKKLIQTSNIADTFKAIKNEPEHMDSS